MHRHAIADIRGSALEVFNIGRINGRPSPGAL
jgi:hypothetical protein